MSKIIYGLWCEPDRNFTEIWSAEKARMAYDRNEIYEAVIERDGAPFCFVQSVTREGGTRLVTVNFFDEALRVVLYYQFEELEPQRLFLAWALHRVFIPGALDPLDRPDGNAVELADFYYYKPEGLAIVEHHFPPGRRLDSPEVVQDTSRCWEPYPSFGQYDTLIRPDRHASPGA